MRKLIEGHNIRLEALIINENKILAIHRINSGEEYYVLPGGGWEEGETAEEGVKREVYEETSLNIVVERLVFSLLIKDDSQRQVYFCKYLGGDPKLGDFNEKKEMDAGEQIYKPIWLPIEDLPKTTLYELELRDWFLANYKNGQLPQEPFVMRITRDKFRNK